MYNLHTNVSWQPCYVSRFKSDGKQEHARVMADCATLNSMHFCDRWNQYKTYLKNRKIMLWTKKKCIEKWSWYFLQNSFSKAMSLFVEFNNFSYGQVSHNEVMSCFVSCAFHIALCLCNCINRHWSLFKSVYDHWVLSWNAKDKKKSKWEEKLAME